MSGGGGGGGRSDLGPAVGGGADQCDREYQTPVNSPKPSVLGSMSVGGILDVDVVSVGTHSTLVVRDSSGSVGGSLTFLGFLQVINCIIQQGVIYKAEILSITGGVYTVRVHPI